MKRIALALVLIVLFAFSVQAIDTKKAEIFFDDPDGWGTEIHVFYNPGYKEIIAHYGEGGISSLKKLSLVNGKTIDFNEFQLIIFAEKEMKLTKDDLEGLMKKETVCQFKSWAKSNGLITIVVHN